MAEDRQKERNYITPAGFRALQAEFEYLRFTKRREVVGKLAEAAAEGDRSENAEYIYRKRQLRDIDRRIRFLMKRMSLAEVIDPAQQRSDRVCFGAQVTLEDEDGKALTYQIVGVDEIDPKQGRISWRSPIGNALIGKVVDDAVTVRWHAGERELTVLAIDFPRQSAAPVTYVPPELALSADEPPLSDEGLEGGEGGEGPEGPGDGEEAPGASHRG